MPPAAHGNPAPGARPSNAPTAAAVRLGCVSYLNAKPLIDGIDDAPGVADPAVRFDVPARLLGDLEAGQVDLALCPVIDYHRAARPLRIVPVGGIACDGSTLTVRLFSRVPIDQITAVHADTDSHTSVALLRVLLHARFGRTVELIDYPAPGIRPGPRPASTTETLRPTSGGGGGGGGGDGLPEAMLLIGDKVVTDSPPAITYPHQLDLGEAWHELTGLPFVFAIWMAPADTELGDMPSRLAALLDANLQRIDAIVARYAARHAWPDDLATEYLGRILRYRIGPRELEAIARFSGMAADLGLIPAARPLDVWSPAT